MTTPTKTDQPALNVQVQTGSKVHQTKEKKSDETKSEVRKSDSKKSGQRKSDDKKPEVMPSSHQRGGSSRYMVQSSPAPHADCQAEVDEKLDSLQSDHESMQTTHKLDNLQSSQKDSLQKGKKVSRQGWPERRKLQPLLQGEMTQEVCEAHY